jgi:hypothetical protein
MRALCTLYPYLKVSEAWQERIAVIENLMHPTSRDYEVLAVDIAAMVQDIRTNGAPT